MQLNLKNNVMNIPENLFYTADHEWLCVDGEMATVGVTDFAQHELGDIVFVEVETVGETIAKGELFGTIEAVKTVSDLLLPVTGEILEFNSDVEAECSVINSDPYGKGWLVKVKMENPSEVSELMNAAQYKELIGA